MALLLSFLVVPPKVAPSRAGERRRPPEEEKESGGTFFVWSIGYTTDKGEWKGSFSPPRLEQKGQERGRGEAEALAKSGIKEESAQKK